MSVFFQRCRLHRYSSVQPARHILPAAVLLCLLFPSLALSQSSGIEKKVHLTSDPPGATVCERKGRDLVCSRMTPAAFTAKFRSEKSTKRYYIRKLGYEPTSVLVRVSDPKSSIKLKRKDIFLSPSQHNSGKMRSLQEKINSTIGNIVFGGGLGLPAYVFVGKIQPVNIAGKVYVKVQVLMDDEFRKGSYRKLSRTKAEQERYQKLVKAILEADTGRLVVELGKALKGKVDAHGIMLEVKYSRMQLVPVDDDTTFTHVYKQYTGQTVSGGYVYDNYLVTSRTLTTGYTNLEQRSQIQTAVFYTPVAAIPSQYVTDTSPARLAEGSVIFLNDNRKSEVVEFTAD